ncbi:metallophosphoesterase family protein [Clostridium sp. A1-XYC3]|uniref:Phosphoesterase n=1 Tax=Clostridium tanneri TaxID=3037988 RepID=A0ABU4JUX9_9CLOT|nr:metallophosphoesterase family protein [Clostridium sp. A1-XYC3]MDW8801916.1 metallophosphoesterase family protein [Clostridium sp. A1-XYC3]
MNEFKIGVISDTHGLLRTKVLELFQNSNLIIHAGDIGSIDIINSLEKIAPVVAVKGNCDKDSSLNKYHKTEVVELGGKLIYVLHNARELDLDVKTSGFHIVISGHSHKPENYFLNDILYLNPGSAGPRRFNLPISAAAIYIDGSSVRAELFDIEK